MGLSLQGKHEDAEKYLTAALGEAIKGFGIDDPFTAAARMQLAEHYAYRHLYELAVPLYDEVKHCSNSWPCQARHCCPPHVCHVWSFSVHLVLPAFIMMGITI